MENYNDSYYKIYRHDDDLLSVVNLQHHDEDDYDQDRFFTDNDGYVLQFYSDYESSGKDKAIEWLDRNVKQEKIDPKYRKVKFNREDYLL